MCGLLGLAVKKDTALTPEIAGFILSQLAYRNEGRGGDSFGVGLVDVTDKKVRLFKTVGKISDKGLFTKSWSHGVGELIDLMVAGKTVVALGHNRKATTGANSQRNAHPF